MLELSIKKNTKYLKFKLTGSIESRSTAQSVIAQKTG